MRRLISFILCVILIEFSLFPSASASIKLSKAKFPGIALSAPADFKTDFEQARSFINDNQFQEALTILLRLIKDDPSNCNLNFLVGYCYYNLEFERNKALPYLQKAVVSTVGDYDDNSPKEKSAPVYAFFYLGKCYHWIGKLDEALANFEKFRGFLVNKSDKLINQKNYNIFNDVNAGLEQVKTAQKLVAIPLRIDFIKIPLVNTQNYSCYGAQLTQDGNSLYYSRERLNEKLRGKSDMYVLRRVGKNWVKNEQTGQNLNGPYNDNFNSISPDGKFLLYSSDRKGVFNVFYSVQDNNKWSEPFDNLSINSNFNETYAVLSRDGNKMFFVSDRPGGFGGKDIYKIEKKGDGSWSQPENLGFTVNTAKDEDTPWLSDNGNRLYFSSAGHTTIGGSDIFYSDFKNNMWIEPVNMGYPINSVANDLYFKYYSENNLLLFSSNRSKGGIDYEILGARYTDTICQNELFNSVIPAIVEDTVIAEQPKTDVEPMLIQINKNSDKAKKVIQQPVKQNVETPKEIVQKTNETVKTVEKPAVIKPAVSKDVAKIDQLPEKEKKARQDSIVKVRQKQVSDSLTAVRMASIKKEMKTSKDQNISIKAKIQQDSIARAQEIERKQALARATQEKIKKLKEKARNDSVVAAKNREDSLKIASAKLAAKQKFEEGQQLAQQENIDTTQRVTVAKADEAKTVKEAIIKESNRNDSLTLAQQHAPDQQIVSQQKVDTLKEVKPEIVQIVDQPIVAVIKEDKPIITKEQDTITANKEKPAEQVVIVEKQEKPLEPVVAVEKQEKPIEPIVVDEKQEKPAEPVVVDQKQEKKLEQIAVVKEQVKQESSAKKSAQFTKTSGESLPPCNAGSNDTLKRYTVQVGAGWMKIKYFKGIDEKKICYGPDGMARFIVGVYTNKKDAVDMAEQLRLLGFTDAWVPEVDDKRCICPDNSLVADGKSGDDPKYTVQVGAGNMKIRYFKALRQVKACEGTDGLTRFTFGEFNTLDEAQQVKKRIVQLGYLDAWTPPIDENRCGEKVSAKSLVTK